jgi:hypothetical protein
MSKCDIESRRQALDELHDAALAWWEGRRPVGWDLREHLSNPAVNTSMAEAPLARAVDIGAL